VLKLGDCFSLASISLVPKLMTTKKTHMSKARRAQMHQRQKKNRDESNPEFGVEVEERPLTYVPPADAVKITLQKYSNAIISLGVCNQI
jgi:hypothetical protein